MNGEEWLTNRRIMNKHLLRENSDKWLEGPIKATIQNFVQKWKKKAGKDSFIPNLESDLYRLSIDGKLELKYSIFVIRLVTQSH